MPSCRTFARLARVALPILGFAVAGLSGCTSPAPGQAAADELRLDPSPEVVNLYQRYPDVQNEFAVMADENVRMLAQDWHRAFYWDRPSRLAREPIPR